MRSDTAQPEILSGRYELTDTLGRGGMGDVHAAYDQRLEREVAVKMLRVDWADEPAMCRRFASEARAAARLTHPNVVAIYDTGEQDGVPFIVMERLPGTTLSDRMANGPLSEDLVRRVACDVLAALTAAHQAGIVHRDVKPGNVLLAEDDTAKVGDFGIAKLAEGLDQTVTAMVLGTPVYIAPERFKGAPATPRSDLYSVGVVIYEALAARKPFVADNPIALVKCIEEGDRPSLPSLRTGLSPSMVGVVERSMARDPDDRFTSADEMAAALRSSSPQVVMAEIVTEHATEGATEAGPTVTRFEPAHLAPPPRTVPAPRRAPVPVRRKRRWVRRAFWTLVLTLFVVGTVGAAAWYGLRDRNASDPTEPSVPAEGLPDSIRDALTRLEETVQP
jgi:eukaryotic-like serine/threonine-protein kinase